jgi:uncharacterized protein (DUF3084 family)
VNGEMMEIASIEDCVDRLRALRTEIAEAQEKEKALRSEYATLKKHLIQRMYTWHGVVHHEK